MGETNSIKTNYLREKGVQVPFAPRTFMLLVEDKASGQKLDKIINDIIANSITQEERELFKAAADNVLYDIAYGIEKDLAITTPECTRIGNMDLHRSLPIQSGMRGCLLADDGTIVKYLNANDWTSETRDGSQGQVMIEIPKHYVRYETKGTKIRIWLSTKPWPGFNEVPLQYVSAYEASLDRSNNKLSSVVNTTTAYRGGNNTSSWDGTYRSLLGMPATSIGLPTYRAYARNRNSNDTRWNCMTYLTTKTIIWLFVVEYSTLNCLAGYNGSLTADGFRQGGLGDGITTLNSTKWSNFNSLNPFIPCGYTDEFGNNTGVKTFTMPTEYVTTTTTVSVPRYRGIENPFGHIWKWTDGINIQINPTEANGDDNTSKIYVCYDASNFLSNNYDNYTYIGNEARNEGYVKEVVFGESGDIIPTICGGLGIGSGSYFCDYHYTSIPTSTSLRGVLFGGFASHGAGAGFFCAFSHCVPTSASAYLGSRLCFLPN